MSKYSFRELTKASLIGLIREFIGPSPSVIFEKKIQTTETYTNDATLHYGFFPENVLGDSSRVFDFFSGFMDKGTIRSEILSLEL